MLYHSEPAVCPNCDEETLYHVIISCNSFMMHMLPSNKCSCGHELTETDIVLSKASPSHRNSVRNRKIRDYIKNSNTDDENGWKCEKCGCTKSFGFGFTCGIEIPEQYKNDERITINNGYRICDQCGHETHNTFESYSDLYDLVEVLDDGNFLCRKKDNFEEIYKEYKEQEKREFKEAEDYLVSIGEITSEEDEEKYADKYYGKHIDKTVRNMMIFSHRIANLLGDDRNRKNSKG